MVPGDRHVRFRHKLSSLGGWLVKRQVSRGYCS
jgi:hypothetical protein